MASFKRFDTSDLVNQLEKTGFIRNFCILAHVDHGKTTLSDSLVSSNGIISERLAGKLRYLDSTEEEQSRGITMHSSAISLIYETENDNSSDRYLINLIDSPGHIDFSPDVSTAARVCDGALILVDVIEGVCTQTHAVIHRALMEKLKPCLVLNKIDRLVLELRMSSTEAFLHIRKIIENINALAYTLLNSELMKSANYSNEDIENHPSIEHWNFSTENGNVVFSSAYDCWGLAVMKPINQWAKKYGLNKNVLKKYIFEDYTLDIETKKISKWSLSDRFAKPLFVQLVLDPIFNLYEHIMIDKKPITQDDLKGYQVSIAS